MNVTKNKKIANSKLINLATKKKKDSDSDIKSINEFESLINKLPESEEDKEIKAKEIASSLIKSIPELVDIIHNDEISDDSITNDDGNDYHVNKDDKNGTEWLEEQVRVLTIENDRLKSLTPENVGILTSEKENLIILFNEVQNNFYGRNSERRRYEHVNLDYLMKTLIELFPFLQEYKF